LREPLDLMAGSWLKGEAVKIDSLQLKLIGLSPAVCLAKKLHFVSQIGCGWSAINARNPRQPFFGTRAANMGQQTWKRLAAIARSVSFTRNILCCDADRALKILYQGKIKVSDGGVERGCVLGKSFDCGGERKRPIGLRGNVWLHFHDS
jgi:hypothetical protein